MNISRISRQPIIEKFLINKKTPTKAADASLNQAQNYLVASNTKLDGVNLTRYAR